MRKGIIVGIFVLLALVIVVAAVLTLGGQKKTFVRAVHLVAVFPDVNGLAVGNNVWFSGVKVGTIKNMRFDDHANVIVEMNVEEKIKQYIKKDSKARISSDGLIGNKIVVIYGGSTSSPIVEENSRLGVDAVLNSDEMLATLQENNKNLLDITNDFKVISKQIATGKGSIGKLLTEETIYNDLQSTMTSLRQTAHSAQSISDNLTAYTARLNAKGSLANDLVTDTVIFNSLRATVAQINQAAAQSSEIITQLRTASAKINDPNSPVGTLLNDRAAAGNLKGALKNLESASGKLDENMEALQHNFLFRGYFRRKARAEKQ